MTKESQFPLEAKKLKSELRTTLNWFLDVVDANSEILRRANSSDCRLPKDVFFSVSGRIIENVELREKVQRRIAEQEQEA